MLRDIHFSSSSSPFKTLLFKMPRLEGHSSNLHNRVSVSIFFLCANLQICEHINTAINIQSGNVYRTTVRLGGGVQ